MMKKLFLTIFVLTLVFSFIFTGCNDIIDRFTPVESLPLPGDLIITSESGEFVVGVKLTANYDGQESVSFQWNRSGAAIGGADSYEYTPTAAGSYTVTISASGYLNKTSDAVTVAAAAANWIKELGNSLVITAGSEAGEINYSFDATNPAADTYTLYYIEGSESDAAIIIEDGDSIDTDGELSGTISGLNDATIYSFVVKAVKAGYTIIYSNVDNATTITVIETLQKPVINLPADVDKDAVPIGTKLIVQSEDDSVSYQWYKDDEPIENETGNEFTPTEPGVYTVIVSKDGFYSNISDSFTVVLPSLSGNISIKLPDGVNASNVLATMSLTAEYTGSEEDVFFQWNKDGTPVAGAKTFTPQEAGSYTVTVSVENYESKTSSSVTVKAFVPVNSITGYAAKVFIDTPVDIGGAVNTGANFTEILWSISDANSNSSAGINNEGKLLAEDYGTITLTAFVENGTAWGVDFEQDYTVEVATFVILNITMEDSDFGLYDKGVAIITSDDPAELSSANPMMELNLTLSTLYNINWYLGNIELATGNTCTLNYMAFNPGDYTLTVFFKDAQHRQWSGNYTFTVSHE